MKKSEFSKDYNSENLHVKQVTIKSDTEITRIRKSIVEHPFGTVKRAMEADYLLTKGTDNATGEFSLVFLAYNLKRVINILGVRVKEFGVVNISSPKLTQGNSSNKTVNNINVA